MLAAVGASISLPALVLGLLLVPVARWRRAEMLVVALLGLVVTALLYSRISAEMEAGLLAVHRAGGLSVDPGKALEAACPT